MYFKWDESYSVGIEKFDSQHKVLFDLLNDFHDSIREKRTKFAVGETLNGLLNYTIYHFSEEEDAMQQHGYPGFEQHHKNHAKLIKAVSEINDRILQGHPVMSAEIIALLVNWLNKHVKDGDKQYSRYLIGKGMR